MKTKDKQNPFLTTGGSKFEMLCLLAMQVSIFFLLSEDWNFF
jgi:hypothetical protein